MPNTLTVFDPAMCCSTGVCGPSVDAQLVRFAADLDWLRAAGVEVERFNLAQQPAAFAASAAVKQALTERGEAALPLVVAGGEVVSVGAYPSRAQLAGWAGVPVAATPTKRKLPLGVAAPSGGCCGDGGPPVNPAAEGPGVLMPFLELDTRVLFFTGKGGVGKTSLACATAIAAGRRGQARAAGEHRSGVEPRRGARRARSGRRATASAGRAGALGAEHRSARQPRTPTASASSGPYRGVLPDAAVAQHGGAALGRLHGGDRRVRRVHPAARRPERHRRLRPRHLRHRAHRPHAAAAGAAGGLDRRSSTRTRAAPPASARSPGCRRSARSTPPPATRCPTPRARRCVLVAAPRALVARRGRAHARRARPRSASRNQRLVVNGVFTATDRRRSRRRGAASVAAGPRWRRCPPASRRCRAANVPLLPFGLVGIDALRRMGSTGRCARPRRRADAGPLDVGRPAPSTRCSTSSPGGAAASS